MFELRSATPILFAESLEPLLPLWDRLGFERTTEVPHGDGLGFVILERDAIQVMLQTLDSARDDDPRLASDRAPGQGVVYFEITDLEALESALEPDEIALPRRTTFYGAEEIFVRDPAGNLLGFAEFVEGHE